MLSNPKDYECTGVTKPLILSPVTSLMNGPISKISLAEHLFSIVCLTSSCCFCKLMEDMQLLNYVISFKASNVILSDAKNGCSRKNWGNCTLLCLLIDALTNNLIGQLSFFSKIGLRFTCLSQLLLNMLAEYYHFARVPFSYIWKLQVGNDSFA